MQSESVLRPEIPRHPFRATFVRARRVRTRHRDDGDLKLFVLSFTAFFICIYSFIF